MNILQDFDAFRYDVCYPNVKRNLYHHFASVSNKPLRSKKQNKLREYILQKNDKLCIYLLTRNSKLNNSNVYLLLDEFNKHVIYLNFRQLLLSFNEYIGLYKIAKYICDNKNSYQKIHEYDMKKLIKYLKYYENIRDYIRTINLLLQLSIFKDLDTNTSKVLLNKFISQIPVPTYTYYE